MLGIPVEHRHRLPQYSLNILGALDPLVSQERLDESNFSVEEFGEVLSQIVDRRRSEQTPKRDGEILMSLILGDVNGRRLTNMELIQNCIFLIKCRPRNKDEYGCEFDVYVLFCPSPTQPFKRGPRSYNYGN